MTERSVVRLVAAVAASDGAGVRLKRVIGSPAMPHCDPFLLLDSFRSDRADDYIAGFPPHPHRGFETVTYMLAGAMRHQDSTGRTGHLRAGSVQWMTAGRGIIHSEMPEQTDGLMAGFQLWVNLPAADKMQEPRYQDIPPEAIPEAEVAPGVRLRVVAGEAGGLTGPVSGIAVAPLYLDVALAAGARWQAAVRATHTALSYVFEGTADIAGTAVPAETLAELTAGDTVMLAAPAGAVRLLLIAGRPLGEPIARYGPFVMNTQDEILDSIRDYQAGRF
ncbi:MAG: pirin family protein [Alphaproteobacteria bacterium]|nr:pirin family protein [Alphaproteobacteria bacterium]